MAFLVQDKIDMETFLDMAENYPVVDVRSPSEYLAGHIPGAHNIPLFDDIERASVGIRYKKEGHINAVLEGLKLSGPSMYRKLEAGLRTAVDGKLLVHCWRGGMRSEAMAWLFSLGGIRTEVLEGGYKSYRHHVLEYLSAERKLIVLGGLTGSGKTGILKYLKQSGRQVIDLEGLANHKGSAFGSLGQPPQPTSEHFSNLLFDELRKTDPDKPVWIEDESRNIGTVFMPEEFFLNMQKNPAVVLMMDVSTRLPRLIDEYSHYPASELESQVKKISKRLGAELAGEAVESIYRGDFARAIEITLKYYDKTYLFSLRKKPREKIIKLFTDTDKTETNARKVIEATEKLSW